MFENYYGKEKPKQKDIKLNFFNDNTKDSQRIQRIPLFSGRPNRSQTINMEDITNIAIVLGNIKTIDEFIARI